MRKEYVKIWLQLTVFRGRKIFYIYCGQGKCNNSLHIEQKVSVVFSTSRSIAFIHVQGVSFPIQGTPTVAHVTGL